MVMPDPTHSAFVSCARFLWARWNQTSAKPPSSVATSVQCSVFSVHCPLSTVHCSEASRTPPHPTPRLHLQVVDTKKPSPLDLFFSPGCRANNVRRNLVPSAASISTALLPDLTSLIINRVLVVLAFLFANGLWLRPPRCQKRLQTLQQASQQAMPENPCDRMTGLRSMPCLDSLDNSYNSALGWCLGRSLR